MQRLELLLAAVLAPALAQVEEPVPEPEPCGYALSSSEGEWTDAQAACEALGGDLAAIDSPAQNEEAVGLLAEAGLSVAWIGLWRQDNGISGFAWTRACTSQILPNGPGSSTRRGEISSESRL